MESYVPRHEISIAHHFYHPEDSGRKKRRKSSFFADELGIGLVESTADISRIEQDDFTMTGGTDLLANLQLKNSRTETVAGSVVANLPKAVSYADCHKEDTQTAIHSLSDRAVSFPKNRRCLKKILTTENFISNLPSHCVPKKLRLGSKSGTPVATEITLVQSSASVKRKLGQGAYGSVFLLESKDQHASDKIAAVKAQTPVGSLTWEFEVLERLRDRLKGKIEPKKKIPFPEPISFVSLADGALLTMQAVSDSGMNFIALVNAYRESGAPSVPELIALHYVSRMLDALVTLHSFGHILVR